MSDDLAPGDEERWSRAALAGVVDPGDQAANAAINDLGAPVLLERLRAGTVPSALERYKQRAAAVDVAAIRARTQQCGSRVLVPGDPEWPGGLTDLAELSGPGAAPPIALWVRGDPAVIPRPESGGRPGVAVVGSRAGTHYGNDVATSIGFELAERGVVVVSGAAYGIDGAAHRGALAAHGLTVAVLANGVDRAYPAGHDALVGRIAQVGAVLSEAVPGQHPTRVRFLTRNRLIAALSVGVVVVEAALRSGALNTLGWAMQLSRHAMAVPGPTTSALSAGPHRAVIERGASLVTDAADVLELVGGLGVTAQSRRRGPERALDALDPESLAVIEAMPTRAPREAGELAVAAGLPVDQVLGALGVLLEDGWVERTDRGWRRAVE